MTTPLEESNLAHIGSKEDHAAKKAAAELDVNWEGAGETPGLQIWRVENKHENGVPTFGLNPWPTSQHGHFYTGDSYLILSTTENKHPDDELQAEGVEGGSYLLDIYFWIGSESTNDEYGVVAYKACELDDLLDDKPVQHRETQYHESAQFLDLFLPTGIEYLEGGIEGGFRAVEDTQDEKNLPTRLFHIRRTDGKTHTVQAPPRCSSMNTGDAFVVDAGDVVYSWFGELASPFEKSVAGTLLHNLANGEGRNVARQVSDVEDDNEEFWTVLGGQKDNIKKHDDPSIASKKHKPTMFVLSDETDSLSIKTVSAEKSNLVSEDVCLVDIGTKVFIWIGEGSTKRERQAGMQMAQTYFKNLQRGMDGTEVVRVFEGQEKRVCSWPL